MKQFFKILSTVMSVLRTLIGLHDAAKELKDKNQKTKLES